MKKYIQIAGAKRSGKDTLAKLLTKYIPNSKVMSFANPLKDIIAKTFNIDQVALDNFKNKPDRFKVLVIDTDEDAILAETNFREILQRFGTEGMKPYFGEDVWQKLLMQEAEKSNSDYVIIPDYRFPEETIQGAMTVKVLADVCNEDMHSSERALDGFKFQKYIDNTVRKMDVLESQAKALAEDIQETMEVGG